MQTSCAASTLCQTTCATSGDLEWKRGELNMGDGREGDSAAEREYPSKFPIGEHVIIRIMGRKEGHKEISLKVRANKALC